MWRYINNRAINQNQSTNLQNRQEREIHRQTHPAKKACDKETPERKEAPTSSHKGWWNFEMGRNGGFVGKWSTKERRTHVLQARTPLGRVC